MALSNWDTLAVDLESNSMNGVFISPAGVKVEFYKNWLYVNDEKGWTEGGAFTKPCVAQIDNGHLTYKDVSIIAIRGPQNGIYAVIKSGYSHNKTLTGMVGCGVYGYSDRDWIGVTDASRKFLLMFLNKAEQLTREQAIEQMKAHKVLVIDETGKEIQTTLYDEAVADGVLEDSLKIYTTPEFEFEEPIRKIKLDGSLRFNQGDAYFARHLGKETPGTPVGKAEEPVTAKMLKNWEKS